MKKLTANENLYNTHLLLCALPLLRVHRDAHTNSPDSEEEQIKLLSELTPLLDIHRDVTARADESPEEKRLQDLICSLLQDTDRPLESIARSRRKTNALVTYVEQQFEVWRKSNKDTLAHRRRRRIVIGYYGLDFTEQRKDFALLAEQERITPERVLKELGHARRELSVLFFGQNGLFTYFKGQDDIILISN